MAQYAMSLYGAAMELVASPTRNHDLIARQREVAAAETCSNHLLAAGF
jgi:hypothetical protein